jgi:hypothetical protein
MAVIECSNGKCPSGGSFESPEQFPSRRLCRGCKDMRRRLLLMECSVSMPPTLATQRRSKVAPAILAEIMKDRAKPPPPRRTLSVTAARHALADECSSTKAENKSLDFYAAAMANRKRTK